MSVVLHTFVARSWFTQMVFFPNLICAAPELTSKFFQDIFAEILHLQGFSSDRSGQMPHGAWPNPHAEQSHPMSKLLSLAKSLTTEFIFPLFQAPIMTGNQKYCVCVCVRLYRFYALKWGHKKSKENAWGLE